MAHVERLCCLLLLASGVLGGACGDDGSSFAAGDGGPDSGTDTDTDADTDTDTDTGSDTGEDEIPPDLPALCSVDVFNEETSGGGDGRQPEVAWDTSSAAALIAWSYDPQGEGLPEQWRIQTTSYDPLAPEIVPVEPFTWSTVASWTAMAARDGGFGAVWLDSRWDPACEPEDPDSCAVDLAFAALDAAGAAAAADPIRLTADGVRRGQPAIAGAPDGWLVAWAQADATATLRLVAAPLSADGVIAEPQIISGDESITGDSADVALAVGGTLAVAVWRADDPEAILAQPMAFDGTPIGEPVIVDQGVPARPPRIAASGDGFAVVWSRRTVDDYEVFSRLLTGAGAPLDEANRLTWTISDESDATVAWGGASYGVFWNGNRASGTEECVDPNCEDQAFASVLDADGALASVPVLLSDNANPSSNGELAWDGSGWTAVWEVRRDLRQQVFRGRMECE
jgi:hypothetical protein